MTAPRRDLLAECNTERLALPEFQDGWCRRCINPECARSLFGQSRFDLRVNTWEDRLFKSPPRMDPSDPRFKTIASQRFLSIDTSAPPEVRSWVDPLDAPKPEPVVVVAPPPPPAPDPTPIPEPKLEPQAPVPVPQEPPKASPTDFLLMNTPKQAGKVLPGVRNPQPTPRDPWAAPEPAENVVPVGGRVKLRGPGV